jgi:aerobic-type carbon monoxide dehydrogenase small subunit (CoxS/CutS family)
VITRTPKRMPVTMTVNGRVHDGFVEPRRLLVDFLRDDLGLTGTHVGCEHGVCGACTILVDGSPARSCLMFAVQANGAELRTVEGLSDGAGKLHPLQEAFREHFGVQCGFCTPGFLMTACDVLEKGSATSEQAVREALSGHICRCTGYQGIVDAVCAASGAKTRTP